MEGAPKGLRAVSDSSTLGDYRMPFIIPPPHGLSFPGLRRFRRANVADRHDAANPEQGTSAARDGSPPHGHLMPQMLGEAILWESLRRQIRNRTQCMIVHQYEPAILFVHATGKRSSPRFGRGLGRLLLFLCTHGSGRDSSVPRPSARKDEKHDQNRDTRPAIHFDIPAGGK